MVTSVEFPQAPQTTRDSLPLNKSSQQTESIRAFFHEALSKTLSPPSTTDTVPLGRSSGDVPTGETDGKFVEKTSTEPGDDLVPALPGGDGTQQPKPIVTHYPVGNTGSDTQRKTAEYLSILMKYQQVADTISWLDTAYSYEHGFCPQGMSYFANLDVDDPDARRWCFVEDKAERQKIRDAARALLNLNGENTGVAAAFNAALAINGHASSMTFEEVKNFIKNPDSIPESISRSPNDWKISNAQKDMLSHVEFLLRDPVVFSFLTNGEGKEIDLKQLYILFKADVRPDMNDKEWGNIPPHLRQPLQDTARILLGANWITDEHEKEIAKVFREMVTSIPVPGTAQFPNMLPIEYPLVEYTLTKFKIPIDKFTNVIYDGDVNPWDIKQMNEGNCMFLVGIGAFAQTPEGRKILHEAVHNNGDGTWDVRFKGNPDKVITVTLDDLKASYSYGDGDVEVLNAAMAKFIGRDTNMSNFPEVWAILTGERPSGFSGSPADIINFLMTNADAIGQTMTVGIAGTPAPNGDITIGTGTEHAYFISKIDLDTGEVVYRNPWDTSKERRMSISDFAEAFSQSKREFYYYQLENPTQTPEGIRNAADFNNRLNSLVERIRSSVEVDKRILLYMEGDRAEAYKELLEYNMKNGNFTTVQQLHEHTRNQFEDRLRNFEQEYDVFEGYMKRHGGEEDLYDLAKDVWNSRLDFNAFSPGEAIKPRYYG